MDLLNDKMGTAVLTTNKIDKIEAKVNENTAGIPELRNEVLVSWQKLRHMLRGLVDQELGW